MIRITLALILTLMSTSALADHKHNRSYSYYYNHGFHNYYDRPPSYRHYHKRSDNDDWAWAVGGLVLGTIIANSNQQQVSPSTATTLPPPQRRVQTCYDEVAYDSNNTPYVARRCFETVE